MRLLVKVIKRRRHNRSPPEASEPSSSPFFACPIIFYLPKLSHRMIKHGHLVCACVRACACMRAINRRRGSTRVVLPPSALSAATLTFNERCRSNCVVFCFLGFFFFRRAPPMRRVLPAAAGGRDLRHGHGDSGPDAHRRLLRQHHHIVSVLDGQMLCLGT